MSKRFISTLVAGVLFCFSTVVASVALAAPASQANFTPAQKQAIGEVVHDYLLQNPQILVEVSKKLQSEQHIKQEQKANSAIEANQKALFNDPETPVVGNPHGTVTLVEFFDYQCIHCKEMVPVVDGLIKANPDLRVVMKDLPIFGKNSSYAASVGIAAYHLNASHYFALHDDLFKAGQPLVAAKALAAAKEAGYQTAKIKARARDPKVAASLKQSYRLADEIGLVGTPAFIIANAAPDGHLVKPLKIFFVPGAADQSTLQGMINKVKQAA